LNFAKRDPRMNELARNIFEVFLLLHNNDVMAPTPAQAAGQKRKASSLPSSNSRKRQKAQDARAIPVQAADAALSASGELNVAAFIKAREFEINALDKSVQKSKKGLMTRAFQQVPRNMRRRTASHNVKKVPWRLRRRAEREVRPFHQEHSKCLLTWLTSCGLDERRQHAHSHSKAEDTFTTTQVKARNCEGSSSLQQEIHDRAPEEEAGKG
jgi:hypothetical protein